MTDWSMFGFLQSGLMLMMITTFQELQQWREKLLLKFRLYLKITGLHPRDEPVNETSDILALDAVGVIFQVIDDVGSNCDLLLGVRGGQI